MADSNGERTFMTGQDEQYAEMQELAAAGLLLPPRAANGEPDEVIDGLRERIYDSAASRYGADMLVFRAVGDEGFVEIIPTHRDSAEPEALTAAA
ncbi:MAG: hypothetical protein ACHQT9_03855 [Candidatus Saccharimonadales bacterium]